MKLSRNDCYGKMKLCRYNKFCMIYPTHTKRFLCGGCLRN